MIQDKTGLVVLVLLFAGCILWGAWSVYDQPKVFESYVPFLIACVPVSFYAVYSMLDRLPELRRKEVLRRLAEQAEHDRRQTTRGKGIE